jgi:small subunit ribosomal protein S21
VYFWSGNKYPLKKSIIWVKNFDKVKLSCNFAALKNEQENMLIINVKPGEKIDYALKRYKKKHRNTKVVDQLRKRQEFTKPSISRRKELIKARYNQKKADENS